MGPRPRAPGAARRRARAAPRGTTCACPTWSPCTAPTCTSTSAWAAPWSAAPRSVLGAADAVMANSSAVAGLLDGVVAPEQADRRAQRHDRPRRDGRAGGRLPARRAARPHGRLPDRAQRHPRPDRGPRACCAARAAPSTSPIAGDGPLRGALEAQAAAGGRRRRASTSSAACHTRACWRSWRARSSSPCPSWDEAFGLVYTEAMAQGTPVVAGQGEGPEDFIADGESGYLVPVRSPDALAGIIARCWTTRRRRRRSAKPAAPPPSS